MPSRGRDTLEARLGQVWWRRTPGAVAWLLWPLSVLYRLLAAAHRRLKQPAAKAPVPVCVVGNWVVGGAGKTPVVIALVRALLSAGHRPGVISRGHGRRGQHTEEVSAGRSAGEVGDEPTLIHRRTGVPVVVGRQRAAAAAALCAAHPEVDVIVSDDGLQHRALARHAEIVVFDDRGLGNGLLLPAGPLRQAVPARLPASTTVLYTGSRPSTPWPGLHVPRAARGAQPLAAWAAWAAGPDAGPDAGTDAGPDAGPDAGLVALTRLRGRPLVALAGIGNPAQFFAMLEAAGLTIEHCPRADHAQYLAPPWPAGTREVITTEKDAVKLAALAGIDVPVWVVPLDCELPEAWLREFIPSLFGLPRP